MQIKLKDGNYLARGTNRACYINPQDKTKCIKVTISGDDSESNKEKKYYKILKKKNISWDMLTKYHGTIETNLGEGLIFDLVRDYNGEVSKVLQYYLLTEERTQSIMNPVLLLQGLKQYQLSNNIIIKDLNAKNIMYQKTSQTEGKLVVIDGVMNNDFLPFSSYISYFSKRKINRRWRTFESSLPGNKMFKNNQYFLKLLQEYPF